MERGDIDQSGVQTQAQQHGPEDEDEDPSLSAAAQCIRFRLLSGNGGSRSDDDDGSYIFGPTFCHQVFPGEYVRGYQPPFSRTRWQSQEEEPPHSSYRHVRPDEDEELDVRVTLSPSCRSCRVDIFTQPPTRKRTLRSSSLLEESSARKKRRATTSGTEDDQSGSNNGENNDIRAAAYLEGSESCEDEDEDEDDGDDDGSDEYDPDSEVNEEEESDDRNRGGGRKRVRSTMTRAGPMSLQEVRERLSTALPSVAVQKGEANGNSAKDEILEDDYLDRPIGTAIDEYDDAKTGHHFCLTLASPGREANEGASSSDVAAYHAQVQKLAVFFIETADDVDVTSEKDGGYWRILYLFRKHGGRGSGGRESSSSPAARYSLAGYMTLYAFVAPFRKPEPGTVMRVCQALLLPPHQRAGHGRRMLHAVHDYFSRDDVDAIADVVEINVEDPAPGFTSLRNCVDYERFLQLRDI